MASFGSVQPALAIVSCCAILVAGCHTRDETAPSAAAPSAAPAEARETSGPTLAGSEWRLVEIQSMDDAVGTRRPDDRDAFTMRLNADGTVNMALDCNRATGTWTAQPSSDPSNGTFDFGSLVPTKALCPPPRLDQVITGQAEYVRGYMLRDGRLSLSLMADGGIQVWEPADIEVPFETAPDAALEDAMRDAAPSYTRAVVDAGGGATARYVYTHVDLNNDGRQETLAFLLGSFFCGTGGCDLMLFTTAQDGSFELVSRFPISRPPVILSPTRSNGWNDLIRLESGGGMAPVRVRHSFDGTSYVESERMEFTEVPPEGRWLLAGELTPDVGAPLAPRP
jgi:heat shock protein HslJ